MQVPTPKPDAATRLDQADALKKAMGRGPRESARARAQCSRGVTGRRDAVRRPRDRLLAAGAWRASREVLADLADGPRSFARRGGSGASKARPLGKQCGNLSTRVPRWNARTRPTPDPAELASLRECRRAHRRCGTTGHSCAGGRVLNMSYALRSVGPRTSARLRVWREQGPITHDASAGRGAGGRRGRRRDPRGVRTRNGRAGAASVRGVRARHSEGLRSSRCGTRDGSSTQGEDSTGRHSAAAPRVAREARNLGRQKKRRAPQRPDQREDVHRREPSPYQTEDVGPDPCRCVYGAQTGGWGSRIWPPCVERRA